MSKRNGRREKKTYEMQMRKNGGFLSKFLKSSNVTQTTNNIGVSGFNQPIVNNVTVELTQHEPFLEKFANVRYINQ